MLNFIDIYKYVSRRLGDQSTAGLAIAKANVNRVQREIAQKATWPFLVDEKSFNLVAPYTTGTATVTLNSFTITGTGTADWDRNFLFRKFRLEDSETFYRIMDVVAATETIRVDRPYKDASSTLEEYEIWKDAYELERDTMAVLRVRIPEQSRVLQPIPVSRRFDLEQGIEEAATPDVYYDAGRTPLVYYNTGTVTTTEGSGTIAGVSTVWDSTMVGRLFRIKGERRFYKIRAVVIPTQLTLDENYRGMNGFNVAYEIDPPGVPLIGVYPRPNDDLMVYYLRKRSPAELEDDDQISDYPDDFHDVLVAGGTYHCLNERAAELGLIDRAKVDYETLLRERINKSAMTDPNLILQAGQWGEVPVRTSFPGQWNAMSRI